MSQFVITVTDGTLVSVKSRTPIAGKRPWRDRLRRRTHRDTVLFVGHGEMTLNVDRRLNQPASLHASVTARDLFATLQNRKVKP